MAGNGEPLTRWAAATKAETEAEEAETEEEAEAWVSLFLDLGWQPTPGEPIALSTAHRHVLVQLRLLAALATPQPTGDPVDPVHWTGTPRTPNLTTEGLSAPHSTLDGLLTIACGAVQLATGLHLLGGIAAILHGAGRLAAPDSPFTKAMRTVRKALTPDITVIQESVTMMAPLPDNDRSGLRDTLCLAAHEITGLDLAALKHQLFAPEQPAIEEQPPTGLSEPDAALAAMDVDTSEIRARIRNSRRRVTVKRQREEKPDPFSEPGLSDDSIRLPPPHPRHEIQEPGITLSPDRPNGHGIDEPGF
ncbi:hypothetical protein ABZ079_26770 [Streptomyces sp. NPDC006314]|uniref:hypothetical protein n=1 Tax=Streptomyces sp. NPDC006314 TaxID=3154475 RepID=UPI0033A50B93